MSLLYFNPISFQNAEKILGQMKSCLCMITKNNEEEKSAGFFCQIPYPKKVNF